MSIRIGGQELAQPKRYLTGTHRSRSPEETSQDNSRFMKPLGITRLANLTGLDCIGVPVYAAIRPNSRSVAVSQGKGLDVASAKASALMESIESWHAERIDRPLRYESFSAMRKSAAVLDVTRLPLEVGGQLRLDVPVLWIEGHDLLQERPVWVPFEAVTTNLVWPHELVPVFALSSNGLASGNHLLEAIVHGLCEVIERDALAFWKTMSFAAAELARVDRASIDDPVCGELLQRLASAGVGAVVTDITGEVAIPTYACEIFEAGHRPRWRALGVYLGFGCHLAPEVAIVRAVSEAIQSRVGFIAGSRDDLFLSKYRLPAEPELLELHVGTLRNARATRQFRSRASRATSTFEGDLELILSALREAGFDSAAVVDLTREEIGIPVVKVVVPGLEGYDCPPGSRLRRVLEKRAAQERSG